VKSVNRDAPVMQMKKLLKRYQEISSFEDINLERFDQPGSDDDAAIHIAAFLGYVNDIEFMLKHVVDVDLPGEIGNTPLHYAALNGHIEVVKLLLDAGAAPCSMNDYRDTPFDFISKNNSSLKALFNEFM
jgi:uncharacterized protein